MNCNRQTNRFRREFIYSTRNIALFWYVLRLRPQNLTFAPSSEAVCASLRCQLEPSLKWPMQNLETLVFNGPIPTPSTMGKASIPIWINHHYRFLFHAIKCNKCPCSDDAVSKHVESDMLPAVAGNQELLCRKGNN